MTKDLDSSEPDLERRPAGAAVSFAAQALSSGSGPLTAARLLAVQRTAGNAAVGALLAGRLQHSPIGRRQLNRYKEIPSASQTSTEWDAGGVDIRVSGDGTMAVAEESRFGGHRLWASPKRIDASNKALTRAGSVIRLKQTATTIAGTAPTGSAAVLPLVEPENVSNSTAAASMEIWADCGKSARDVFGVGGGAGTNYDDVTGTYAVDWKPQSTSASSPKEMKNEIMANTLGQRWYWSNSAEAGWEAYKNMDATERDRFDRRTGINRYATPDVGEGWTMSSGGHPYPGVSMWNFHWAGVVMASVDDRVTLENYSVSQPMQQNANWKFQMYGPQTEAAQTFHEQHLATHQHGDMPISMRVHKR